MASTQVGCVGGEGGAVLSEPNPSQETILLPVLCILDLPESS